MFVNYTFPEELEESLNTINDKESPKVPLRLAIITPIPGLEVIELMPVVQQKSLSINHLFDSSSKLQAKISCNI